MQEINITVDSFSNFEFITSNYNILPNNSINKYGTATLINSEFCPENLRNDTEERVQIYDVGNMTIVNTYFHSGTDGVSRAAREKLCSEILPNLLINSKDIGYIRGDFNLYIYIRNTNAKETTVVVTIF